MYKHTPFRKTLLASGVGLMLLAGSGTAAADTTSQNVTEARQETQIWTTYALSPYLRANDLKVSVHDGTATLSGKVDDAVNKDLATQIALGVSGVDKVDNQIVVQADYVPPAESSARSYGEVIDDATITAKVKSKLLWSKHVDGLSTNVSTESGRVTLQGTAASAAARELAGRLATNTHGVASLDNQLRVSGKPKTTVAGTAKAAVNDTGEDVADTWITAKVKSTFLYSSNVNGSDIAVNTSNGIVTLTGKLDSGAERSLAIELAENVRGVKSVDSKGLTL